MQKSSSLFLWVIRVLAIATFGFWGAVSSCFAVVFPYTDVKPSDPFYNAVKYLVDHNVLRDTPDHRFRPYDLINRDDFAAIVVEVGCKKCLTPEIADIVKYRDDPFVDVQLQNQNFYCISYAKDVNIMQGYFLDVFGKTSCENGKAYREIPFCTINKTSRIEAAATLLRHANIWSEAQNTASIGKREMAISDATDYWYGYAKKGIEIDILHRDAKNKIFPDEAITRQEFAIMAAKIFSANFCEFTDYVTRNASDPTTIDSTTNDTGFSGTTNTTRSGSITNTTTTPNNPNTSTGVPNSSNTGTTTTNTDPKLPPSPSGNNRLTLEMVVYDKTNSGSCSDVGTPSRLDNPEEHVYDFYARTTASGSVTYTWRLWNLRTGNLLTGIGKCLNDFPLPEDGHWVAEVHACDTYGNCAYAYSEISVRTPLSLTINANPLSQPVDRIFQFTSYPVRGVPPYTYAWQLGDGTTSTEANPRRRYERPDIYTASLIVRDSVWNIAFAQISVEATRDLDCDDDGLLDTEDLCVCVAGPPESRWCPVVRVVDPVCTGASCTIVTPCPPTAPWCWVEPPIINNSCWNTITRAGYVSGSLLACSSCPCLFGLDFESSIHQCDTIYPTILDPTKRSIFSRGSGYRIGY